VTACLTCNARKADREARHAGMRLLARPEAPRWPAGLDPDLLAGRPHWQRFVPAHRRAASQ
jgi:hypothetical protein